MNQEICAKIICSNRNGKEKYKLNINQILIKIYIRYDILKHLNHNSLFMKIIKYKIYIKWKIYIPTYAIMIHIKQRLFQLSKINIGKIWYAEWRKYNSYLTDIILIMCLIHIHIDINKICHTEIHES